MRRRNLLIGFVLAMFLFGSNFSVTTRTVNAFLVRLNAIGTTTTASIIVRLVRTSAGLSAIAV
jgi:hypothetical protein